MDAPDLETPHAHSSKHRAELEASDQCGCFYCLEVFPPQQVRAWIDGGTTALCPYCETDVVIGSAAGFPLSRTFLREMRRRWFCARPQPKEDEVCYHVNPEDERCRSWAEYEAMLLRADTDTRYHRKEILASRECGCYWCLAIFPPTAIEKWTDEGASGVGQTALCPFCGEAGVLGSADGYPISREFLLDVRKPYF